VDAKNLNKRALESLVKAGAFDALAERAALLASLDRLLAYAQRVQKQRDSGQGSLFDLMGAADQPAIAGPGLENMRRRRSSRSWPGRRNCLGFTSPSTRSPGRRRSCGRT
jgi:DNA polymerase III alpha subunit